MAMMLSHPTLQTGFPTRLEEIALEDITFNVEYDGSDAELSASTPSLASSSSTAPSPCSEALKPSPSSSSSVLNSLLDPVSPSLVHKEHIPRPANSFILFRKEYIQKQGGDLSHDQQQLSKAAAQVWGQMSKNTRATYQQMAEKVKEEHLRMYPGYTYMPKRKSTKQNKEKNTKQPKKKTTRHPKEKPARMKLANASPIPGDAALPTLAFITFPIESTAQSSASSDILVTLPLQQTEVLIENEIQPVFLESYSNVDFIDPSTSIGYPEQASTNVHVDPFESVFDFAAYCGDGSVDLGSQQGNLTDGYPDIPLPSLYTYYQPETVHHYGHHLDNTPRAIYHAHTHTHLQSHVLSAHGMSNVLGLELNPYPQSDTSLAQYPVNQYSTRTFREYGTDPLFPIDNSQAAVFTSSFGF